MSASPSPVSQDLREILTQEQMTALQAFARKNRTGIHRLLVNDDLSQANANTANAAATAWSSSAPPSGTPGTPELIATTSATTHSHPTQPPTAAQAAAPEPAAAAAAETEAYPDFARFFFGDESVEVSLSPPYDSRFTSKFLDSL